MEKLDQHLQSFAKSKDDEHDLQVFRRLYQQFLDEPATIDWSQMSLPKPEVQINYESLPPNDLENAKDVLNRLAVVKLNGGLGTTMGCKGPKSLIVVKDGLSFLDFSLLQNKKLNEKYSTSVPLLLMNSFNTELETTQALASKPEDLKRNVRQFTQSRCTRIFADTLLPVPTHSADRLEDGWYPPGHGNVFESMSHTGILDQLLAEGRDIAFFSNIDNTGACVDLRIARAMCDGLADYIMEVTPKTVTDIKGGTLIEINGSLMHLEMPQVPQDKIGEFCSLNTFKMFNTNNIWVNLRAVKAKLASMKMEILANKKKLMDGKEVIQLETSIGGAIRNFEKASSLHVGRHRFLPVNNCYFVDPEDFVVKLAAERQSIRPIVQLSPEFSSVDKFLDRFKSIPDLSQLISLKISGDVWFGENTKLIGNCCISAEKGESLHIGSGAIIQGDA